MRVAGYLKGVAASFLHSPAFNWVLMLVASLILLVGTGGAEAASLELVGLVLAVAILSAWLLSPLGWIAFVIGPLAAIGAGIQVRLDSSPSVPILMLVAGGLLGSAAFAVGRRLRLRKQFWFGFWLMVAMVAMVAVAFVSAGLFGSAADAQALALTLPGVPQLRVGELARAMAIIASAFLLAGGELVREGHTRGKTGRKEAYFWVGAVLLPVGVFLTLLVFAGDLGPAVVLAFAVGMMVWRALGPRLASPLLVAAAGILIALGFATGEFITRFADVLHPKNPESTLQLAVALRGLGNAGFVGGGPGSGPLGATVPAGNSDYAAAVLGGDMGLIFMISTLACLMFASLRMLRMAAEFPKDQAEGLLATGVGWSFLAITVWTGLGNLGLMAFTGIDVPLVALNGMSAMGAGVSLGALSMAMRKPRLDPNKVVPAGRPPATSESGRRLASVATLVVTTALVASTVQAANLTWRGGRFVDAQCTLADGVTLAELPLLTRVEDHYTSVIYVYAGDVADMSELPMPNDGEGTPQPFVGETFRVGTPDDIQLDQEAADGRTDRHTTVAWDGSGWQVIPNNIEPATRRDCEESEPALAANGEDLDPTWLERQVTYSGDPGNVAGETIRRLPRGPLLFRDGSLMAYSQEGGRRVYEDPTGAIDTGFFTFATGNPGVGLEAVAAGALTCGVHRSGLRQAMSLGRRDECDPGVVVSTIEPSLQSQVRALVDSPYPTSIMVLDVETAGIQAVATTTALNVEVVTKDDEGADRVVTAMALSEDPDATLSDRIALSSRAATSPFNNPPYTLTPSGIAQGAVWPPAFGEPSSPGSVLKMVTAAAGARAGVEVPPLPAELEVTGGPPLGNEWGGECPTSTLQDMLTYSCNNVAGFVGVQVGKEGLQDAARDLGLDIAGSLVGPPDLSASQEPLRWSTGQGVQDSLGFGDEDAPVESALARAAIGQEGVRLTVAEVAGLTDAVATGVKRPLTMVAGMCIGGDFELWDNPGEPINEDLRLDVVREGMAGVVQPYGTAPQLGGLADYAKTGTAELGDGKVASWVTAVGGSHIVTVRVMPGETPELSDPSDVPGQSASDVAVRVFEMIGQPGAISADENPCGGD